MVILNITNQQRKLQKKNVRASEVEIFCCRNGYNHE